MQWIDEGIVLGVKRHGESSAIVELMTPEHGRHLGLVRGGSGSRMRPTLQPGNTVSATWRARLDEHLGNYTIEGLRSRAGLILGASHGVYGLTHLAALTRLLPERDPHRDVYEALEGMLDRLDDPERAGPLVARFELMLLSELGFGLDLTQCAATGGTLDLAYVSPKSGRAVSREAGEPWRDKLMQLPRFLLEDHEEKPSATDVANGFEITGFFLARHLFEPRGLPVPDARRQFIAAILRAAHDPAM
jgi:DNA repair protein RecO (recombination protein O)